MSTYLLLALQVTAFVCIGGVHASDDLTADEEELSKLIGVLGTVHIYSMISLFYVPGDQDSKIFHELTRPPPLATHLCCRLLD